MVWYNFNHIPHSTYKFDINQYHKQRKNSTGRPTDWLVNSGLFTSFSHELSQIVLRHYTRNVINIVVCAIINNWTANNARKLIFGIIFQSVQCNRTEPKKTCISDRAIGSRDTSRVAIQPEDGIVALAECLLGRLPRKNEHNFLL